MIHIFLVVPGTAYLTPFTASRCVAYRDLTGGGVEITPPPPPVLGWLRPPPVRGLRDFFLSPINILHFPTFSKIKWPKSEEKLNFGVSGFGGP